MGDDWTYRFTPRARDELRTFDEAVANRIVSKLEEVVDSEFREPLE